MVKARRIGVKNEQISKIYLYMCEFFFFNNL